MRSRSRCEARVKEAKMREEEYANFLNKAVEASADHKMKMVVSELKISEWFLFSVHSFFLHCILFGLCVFIWIWIKICNHHDCYPSIIWDTKILCKSMWTSRPRRFYHIYYVSERVLLFCGHSCQMWPVLALMSRFCVVKLLIIMESLIKWMPCGMYLECEAGKRMFRFLSILISTRL